MARQHGINKTNNPYVMFLDTGDIFISKEIQYEIADSLKDSKTNIFFWTYYYNEQLTDFTDNRMHGKLYKRSFLEQYGITFCAAGSYMDEDIGFNRTCRIISRAIDVPIKMLSTPIIKWIKEENSITQKDNHRLFYQNQTRGLALNAQHEIETLYRNNFDVGAEINEIAGYLYYWFIHTLVNRPEYAQDAWNGAKIFFDYYKDKIHLNNLCLHPNKLKECLRWKTSGKIKFPINLHTFNQHILQFSEIPNFYI